MLSFINSLAQVTLYSTIVILSVLLIRRLFAKRLHIIFLSILWIIVLARLILPVTINSPINLDTFKSLKGKAEVQSDTTIENSSNDYAYVGENAINEFIPSGDTAFANSDFVTQTYTTEFEETQFQNDKPSFIESLKTLLNSIFKNKMFLSIIFVIWLFGAWVSLLRNFFAIYDFNRKVKQCRKITNIEILNSLMKGKRILSIDKSVVICECNFIDTPVTYGLRSPKILIPKDYYSSININKMQMVLLHELSHVKNKDILRNYIWLIARIVYWYNPIVTIAYNKYLEDIEYISDNAVIKNTSSQNLVDYIQSLLDSLEFSSKYMKVPCAISFCKSKSTLRKRVEIMLKPKKTSKVIGTVTALICIMLCIVCFTTACIGKTDIIAEAADNPISTEAISVDDINTDLTEPVSNENDIKTIELTTEIKSLKQDPVGSKESALALANEIAERLGIPNDQGFGYINMSNDSVPPFHAMQLNGDAINNIWIYDFNGEIKYIQTNAYLTDDETTELEENQLKQIVVEFSNKVYPDTILTVKDISVLEREWKENGETISNIRYIVCGDLFDKIDGSTRKLTSAITPNGEILTISAEYNGLDYLNIPREKVIQVLDEADIEYNELVVYQRDEQYGEYRLHISLGDGIGSVTLSEDDLSLLDYLNTANATDAEYSLSSEDISKLTKQYLDRFYPDNKDVVINTEGKILEDCIVEGTYTGIKGETDFYIQMDGDGKLYKIGISTQIDMSNLEKIDMATALETAIDTIIGECSFADRENLKLMSSEEYKDEYKEVYSFAFEYISSNPTVRDYSFTAEIDVDVYSNKPRTWRVDYINDGLNTISEEEAVTLARQYIVEEFNVDANKLVYKEFIVITGYVLEFQVNFEYDDGRSFGASILADTGDLDGIGWGE